MIKLGITGNMGSGKSTVCNYFEDKGVPVYYADKEAKSLIGSSEQLQRSIAEEFGRDMFEQGELNRKKLADIVFKDEKALQKLNQLIHPVVYQHLKKWMHQQEKSGHKIAIEEAALTFEAKHEQYFDIMLTVIAPRAAIIERVTSRDKITAKEVINRLERQWPQKEKAMLSDAVILNDEQHSLIFQIENLIERWELPIH